MKKKLISQIILWSVVIMGWFMPIIIEFNNILYIPFSEMMINYWYFPVLSLLAGLILLVFKDE